MCLQHNIFWQEARLYLLSLTISSKFSMHKLFPDMGTHHNQLCFLFFLCSFINSFHLCVGADTISTNQSISGDQTIVSSGGNFELGFFRPGNSSNYYIGIWYTKVSDHTVIWVANRENPISDKHSSHLKIVNGDLVLLDESDDIVWSTDTNFTTSSLMAVLLDEGNLVLKNGSNSKLWQSLDYPSHTWLPGTKIGYNKRTNRTQILTSWKNSEDPGLGMYTMEVDPIGNQYLIKFNRSKQIWSTGAWNGQVFSHVPDMGKNHLFNFSYISNENETYFIYFIFNTSLISRFIMDYSGQIKELMWMENTNKWNLFWSEPRQQCQVGSLCGPYGTCSQLSLPFCTCLSGFKQRLEKDWSLGDYSGGCVRKTELQCDNSTKTDRFLLNTNMGLPDNPKPVSAGSKTECESICSSNCSCTAYAYDGSGCKIWTGDLMNLQKLSEDDGNGKLIYVKLASSEFSDGKNKKPFVLGAVVGSIAAVMILLILVMVLIKRRRRRLTAKGKAVEGSLMAFGYKDLRTATKNFSETLGRGGFGSVFKGTLPDSTVIAVKKLEGIEQGEKQFRTEVSTIGTIQHVNLVRLRGFCSEGNMKLLVYEYMPNGSIDSHIFHEKQETMSWKVRYQIALGIARGLVYLHDKCRDCIIHCDIKPENILLDAEFCPKVADFGLAKLVGRDFSRVLTTMRGTIGYLAPEWISGIAVTAKADVYSYGMMLFEFISGRRNTGVAADGRPTFFPSWAARVTIDEGDVLGLLDPRLNRIADIEQVTKLCRVACWCIQEEENLRPTMSLIVQILEGVSDVNLPPIPRALRVFLGENEDVVFFAESSSSRSFQDHPMQKNSP